MMASLILVAAAGGFMPAFPAFAQGVEMGADKDLRGQRAPALQVATWISEKPNLQGKTVLVDFWATWCGPCRATIPELNKWAAKFKEDLVIIGLTDEEPATIREFMKMQPMEYFIGTDPMQRTSSALGIRAIPNVMIFTPDGIVRYQGIPLVPENALTEKVIEQIIRAYEARRTPSSNS